MKTLTDNELRSLCFNVLAERVGYLETERFIVLMNRAPEDYTAWREAQPDSTETIEELGMKIMSYDHSRREKVLVG